MRNSAWVRIPPNVPSIDLRQIEVEAGSRYVFDFAATIDPARPVRFTARVDGVGAFEVPVVDGHVLFVVAPRESGWIDARIESRAEGADAEWVFHGVTVTRVD